VQDGTWPKIVWLEHAPWQSRSSDCAAAAVAGGGSAAARLGSSAAPAWRVAAARGSRGGGRQGRAAELHRSRPHPGPRSRARVLAPAAAGRRGAAGRGPPAPAAPIPRAPPPRPALQRSLPRRPLTCRHRQPQQAARPAGAAPPDGHVSLAPGQGCVRGRDIRSEGVAYGGEAGCPAAWWAAVSPGVMRPRAAVGARWGAAGSVRGRWGTPETPAARGGPGPATAPPGASPAAATFRPPAGARVGARGGGDCEDAACPRAGVEGVGSPASEAWALRDGASCDTRHPLLAPGRLGATPPAAAPNALLAAAPTTRHADPVI
jgi:hypothetical protein